MPTTKRLNASLMVMFGVIVAVVAFAGPAEASPYTTQPTISVSTQTPKMGSSLRVCGTGFHARARVTITLDRHIGLGSVVTDRSGAFCKTVRLPARVSGDHTVWATDGHGGSASAAIHITRSRGHGDRGHHHGEPARGDGDEGHGNGDRGRVHETAFGGSGRVELAAFNTSAGTTNSVGTATSVVTTTVGASTDAGATVFGIGALGSLLLVGGALTVFTSRRRKDVA